MERLRDLGMVTHANDAARRAGHRGALESNADRLFVDDVALAVEITRADHAAPIRSAATDVADVLSHPTE